MAISVYGALLLTDYRRKKGEIEAVKKEIKELARKAIEIEGHVAALATILRLRDPEIDLDAATAIRTTPRVRDMKHGRLTKLILSCLRDARGEIVSQEEVVAYVVRTAGEPADRAEEVVLRLAIRKSLKRLVARGVVLRHHPSRTGLSGSWSMPDLPPVRPPSPRGGSCPAASSP